jgi:hypothetical protein
MELLSDGFGNVIVSLCPYQFVAEFELPLDFSDESATLQLCKANRGLTG